MRTLAAIALIIFGLTCAHAWLTLERANYELQLVECRGEAAQANELTSQLLSKGRFVRRYDPKTGASVYTYRR